MDVEGRYMKAICDLFFSFANLTFEANKKLPALFDFLTNTRTRNEYATQTKKNAVWLILSNVKGTFCESP